MTGTSIPAPMGLTILNVAYPLAPVGPDAVGGAEQVLAAIDRALVASGHRSFVVAQEGSRCAGTLIPLPKHDGPIDELALARAQAAARHAIETALRREAVDLVHFHGVHFERYLPATDVPVLATLHLPPEWYAPQAFLMPGVYLQCVSASQRRRCPPGAHLVRDVENGIDLDAFRPAKRRRGYAVSLGRICPEKGFHFALRAARAAGMPLLLAGRVFDYEVHRRYFGDEIAPLLDATRRFVGPIGPARKRRLLGAARCVVVPSLAPETSSLVAMEALASGAPVLAYAAGALSDIVEHGRTGFIARSVDELGQLMLRAGELRPEECRASAERRFSARRMTTEYLELYAELAARPRTRTPFTVETLYGADALRGIEPEWQGLWARCPDATPFQHPAWLLPWCAHLARHPAIAIALRTGGRLAALVPAELSRERGERVLRLLGGAVTDHLDGLVDPVLPTAAIDAVIDAVLAACDRAELDRLRPESPLLQALRDRAQVRELAPALPLSPDLSAVPAARLHELAYLRRRATREAGMRIEAARAGNLDPMLDSFFDLHTARWHARGEEGVLSSPAVQRFHRDATHALESAGFLRLYVLHLHDRAAAAFYGFSAHGRACYYLSGFDPSFDRYSPGTLIVGHAIEQASREGATEFDFLRGREAYKYRWGARDRPCYAVELRASAAALPVGSGA
jgi:CelD/BcsL family acetyltransferase involved in cellulose biosynthesis/glycosyltransferase involved in cell wall biosynthesis